MSVFRVNMNRFTVGRDSRLGSNEGNDLELMNVISHNQRRKKQVRKLALWTGLMMVFATGAFAQLLPGVTDTVRLAVVGDEHYSGVQDGNFAIQVRISHDTAWSGGSLGFTWASDSVDWQYDSTVFNLAVVTWEIRQSTSLALANSMAKAVIGGVAFSGASNIAAGQDQLFATIYFSLKSGQTFTAGESVTIDSSFVPPAGPFQVVYPGILNRKPRFKGAQLVTFNDVAIGGSLPTSFAVEQNYPNPFNPETKIRYSAPRATDYTIDIFNVLGQRVRTLSGYIATAGTFETTWNGRDDNGAGVASGMYFYTFKAGEFVSTRKMLLTK